MSSITIELPDDLAERAHRAGLLDSPLIEELIAAAVDRATRDAHYFQQQVTGSLAQADAPNAHWLTHDEVMAEWGSERDTLLAGKQLPVVAP